MSASRDMTSEGCNDEEVGGLFVSARTMSEYTKMFRLSDSDLLGCVLDCGAGAASFTAELNSVGGEGKAIDPLYGEPRAVVESRVRAGVRRASANVWSDPSSYTWDFAPSAGEHLKLRTGAADRFLLDFEVSPETYLAGALPNLPIDDSTFDLVLCSYLLFTYASIFDEDFHYRAIGELLRVARGEVRIFPLVGYECAASPALKFVMEGLEANGVDVAIVEVDYSFQRGADRMLVIKKDGDRAAQSFR